MFFLNKNRKVLSILFITETLVVVFIYLHQTLRIPVSSILSIIGGKERQSSAVQCSHYLCNWFSSNISSECDFLYRESVRQALFRSPRQGELRRVSHRRREAKFVAYFFCQSRILGLGPTAPTRICSRYQDQDKGGDRHFLSSVLNNIGLGSIVYSYLNFSLLPNVRYYYNTIPEKYKDAISYCRVTNLLVTSVGQDITPYDEVSSEAKQLIT